MVGRMIVSSCHVTSTICLLFEMSYCFNSDLFSDERQAIGQGFCSNNVKGKDVTVMLSR